MGANLIANGNIYTMDPEQPRARWLAVAGERLAAVGHGSAAPTGEGLSAGCDLRGLCVIPGMVDCHLHFETLALKRRQLDPETETLAELLRRVAARAHQQPAGTWILGFGWNQNVWGTGFPDRHALDEVAPDHPVFLQAKSGHAGWANSLAMELAGVSVQSQSPAGGEIVRDAAGAATGIFLESAQSLVGAAIPEPSLGDAVAAMEAAQQEASAMGLTGVHDLDGSRALRAWQVLRGRGQLELRVYKSVPGSLLDEAIALGIRTGLGDERLRLGGVKLFADGALGPRTAWMLSPYEQEPGNRGMPLTDMDTLRERVLKASAAGLAVMVHAIGDRANREVLDILDQVRRRERERGPGVTLRHRIEHVQLLDPADRARLAPLQVIASMQPIHATSDMGIVERYWGARGDGAYAFRTLLDHGTHLAFGSDAPVETAAPLRGIHAAVTRRRADGAPGSGGWRSRERLDVTAALHGYTLGAAYASGEERDKGSLSVGKLADLVVLDRDIFQVAPMEIMETQVLATMVGGRWVHRSPDFDPGD